MSSENTEFDDGPAPDPFEAELVAYLDGELDAVAGRKVEARLANDPEARARAAELKKSFDLLDYLPKPEPSPSFTTRTLDLIPAIKSAVTKSASAPHQTSANAAARSAGGNSGPMPVVSTSMPVAIFEGEGSSPVRLRARPLLRVAGVFMAVAAFALVGYCATAVARTYLFPTRDKDDEARAEPKADPDPRVIEHLPLYAVADDIAFVQELAKPELFGDEPAVVYDAALKIPHSDTADRSSGKHFDVLLKSFRAMPSARQAEIVKLDHDLHVKEPKERDRLFRSLEVYAVWLERLGERDRRAVLGAATPITRQRAVLEIREQQWTDALPAPHRKMLDALAIPTERAALKQQWKEEEAIRRDRRAFIRLHAEAFAANKSPWPFDTEAGRKDVVEFARATFKPDEQKRCRLAPDELAEYRRTLLVAERDGAWAWYGLTVYEFSKLHRYLPESDNAKLMMTELNDLPEVYTRALFKKGGLLRVKPSVIGKWPEFPLDVHELPFVKSLPPNSAQLGPARLNEFKPAVRDFVTKELLPKLTPDEKATLKSLDGKWPEYPRKLVEYARDHDLSVPGVTLPGSPKKWDATYGIRPGGRPPN